MHGYETMTRNISTSAPTVIPFVPPPLLQVIQLPEEPVIKCGKVFSHHILITDLKSNKYLHNKIVSTFPKYLRKLVCIKWWNIKEI